jgi:ABC-type branched-subunit amino acid transport system substrate-binding protein
MRRALPILCCALLLVAAACGSRVETSSAGNEEIAGPAGGSQAGPAAEEQAMVGTVPLPCSDEEAEGTDPTGTPGVSDDQIRIGVISDRENPATPLPTVGIEESVRAFVELCNASGGINGREIVLEAYDSQLSKLEEATQSACRADLYALVGTGSVLDQQGITTREECGLPEVGAYSATSTRAESKDFFQPVPGNSAEEITIGFCKHMAEQFPDAVERAAILYTDLQAASSRALQQVEGCESGAGFDFKVVEPVAYGSNDFAPIVSQMRSEGVRYFTMVSSTAETLGVLDEIEKQGLELDVVDLGAQYYDKTLAASERAEGAFVVANTVPLNEGDEIPALATYLDAMASIGADDMVTTLGVQAFSAALLWATTVDALGNDLTRETLVSGLAATTEWDGGGLHMVTNPGEGDLIECFVYLQVTDGDFQRAHPDEGFDCDPSYIHTSDRRYE